MKKSLLVIIWIIFLPVIVFAYTSPGKPLGFVSDYAGIISDSDEKSVTDKLSGLKAQTGTEIAVVTVLSLGDETVETFAVKLFEEWGIGEKGKDNGLLILVAPNEREVKIETGYGLEGVITDIQASNVIQKIMVPAFKAGDYSSGIKEATDSLVGIIDRTIDPSQFSEPIKSGESSGYKVGFELIIFFLFFIVNILSHTLSKTKSWWLGGLIGAGIGVVISIFIGFLYAGLASIIVLTILGLIFDYIVSKAGPGGRKGPGGFWFGPGLGGGHGGGGFGGFGGGMSGGGGASGRW